MLPYRYDMPQETSEYVHRVGRTARAGRSGCSLIMVHSQEEAYVTKFIKWKDKPADSDCRWQCNCESGKQGCDSEDKCVRYVYTAETKKCELLQSLVRRNDKRNLQRLKALSHGLARGSRARNRVEGGWAEPICR